MRFDAARALLAAAAITTATVTAAAALAALVFDAGEVNALKHDFFRVLAGQLQHLVDVLRIGRRDDHVGLAAAASAAGAANPVHIVVGVVRYVVVEDVADVRNIEAPGRDVRGAEQLELSLAEALQRARTGRLVEVAMDRRSIEAVSLERLGDDVDFRFPVAEDDAVAHVVGGDQHAQRGALGFRIGGRQAHDILRNRFGGGRRAGRLDPNRIVEELLGEPGDLRRHGRREEQRLLLRRRQFENSLNVGNEAHVEHAVGFVDHHDLDAGHQQLAALEMVQQAAGRGDQDVDAPIKLQLLVPKGDAADQQRPGEGPLLALGVFVEGSGDLVGQLPGRSDDEGARHARLRTPRSQAFDHRQGKGGGLAGAGLGDAKNVAALQRDGDGLSLDRRGGRIAGLGHSQKRSGRQAQFGKFGHSVAMGAARPPKKEVSLQAAAARTAIVTRGGKIRRASFKSNAFCS